MSEIIDILGMTWREFAVNNGVNQNCALLYKLYESYIIYGKQNYIVDMHGVIDENKKAINAWNMFINEDNNDVQIYRNIINSKIIHDLRFTHATNNQIYELTKHYKFADNLIKILNEFVDFDYIKYNEQ